jgi:hypothetical protein
MAVKGQEEPFPVRKLNDREGSGGDTLYRLTGSVDVGACQNNVLSALPPPALVGLYSTAVGDCAKPA